MEGKTKEILVDEKQIDDITRNIAEQINTDYKGKNLTVIVLLKGSFIFAADIFRRLTVPCKIDFMIASSYGDKTFSNGLKIKKDIELDITDKDVLIIDDIMDSGVTLNHIKSYLVHKYRPSSVKTCVLLDKPERRTENITPDYVGTTVADKFIVGYGLDFGEYYRNSPCITTLTSEQQAEVNGKISS